MATKNTSWYNFAARFKSDRKDKMQAMANKKFNGNVAAYLRDLVDADLGMGKHGKERK